MKFVIKSLLFVNLLLQLTSSLRKCFDHDQNLMLTIILLAVSLIGLIGLTIGNRFILIIFAACMTLMLIASITIYAIGKTEKDSMQPKVPYFINVPSSEHQLENEKRVGDPNKLKSLVSKLLNRQNNQKSGTNKGLGKRLRNNINRTRISGGGGGAIGAASNNLGLEATHLAARSMTRKAPSGSNSSSLIMLVPPTTLLDDYSDEAQSLGPQLLSQQTDNIPMARGSSLRATELKNLAALDTRQEQVKAAQNQDQEEDEVGDLNQVRSEQWIAYERYLYEKYLNMVSQSIDLIMHTILASWMALLLDDDADQCFGNKHSSSSKSSQLVHGGAHKEAPVYNYNGVRYSIRPDGVDDSPARVVVR